MTAGWSRSRRVRPRGRETSGTCSGLTGADTAIVGIDFRVQDQKLYGVGNGGGVYTIDATTAKATFVNSLTVPLSGTFFGVDFNPVADRLRIVSDTGQNLAHNVNAGGVTASNTTLSYTAPPATPEPAMGITGAVYTNNDLGSAQHRHDAIRPGYDAWTRSSSRRLPSTAPSS